MEKTVNEQPGVQTSGRTVEEAIQKGLAELGATRDQVEVELLSSAGDDPDNQVVVQLTRREQDAMDMPVLPVTSPHLAAAPVTAPAATDATVSAALPEGADLSEVAKSVLEKLLRGMGIRSQIVVHHDTVGEDGPEFVLDIVGADLGVLIGRRGETLRDLEYLCRLIVGQQAHSNVRFAVDVEGYRARRERVLRELAKRMADRVRQSHQPITLEAMPPNERRIVHITLRDHPNVKTQSIGEGDYRRVMILPK